MCESENENNKNDERLTLMENKVMTYLHEGGWYNWGSEPTYSDVFSHELSSIVNIPDKQLRGVLASLVKKKLIHIVDIGYHDFYPNHKSSHIIYPTYDTYVFYGEQEEWIAESFGVKYMGGAE